MAFLNVSLEAIAAAYTEADGDYAATHQILSRRFFSPITHNLHHHHHHHPSSSSFLPTSPISTTQLHTDNVLNNSHFPPLKALPLASPTSIKASSVNPSEIGMHRRLKEDSKSCGAGSYLDVGHDACQYVNKSRTLKGSASFGTVSCARMRRAGVCTNWDMKCGRSEFSSSNYRSSSSSRDMFEMEEKDVAQKEKVEEYLYSLLGNDFQLGIDYVRDVLGQCQGDVAKSLDILLNVCKNSSNYFDMRSDSSTVTSKGDHSDADCSQSHYSVDFSIDAMSEYDVDSAEILAEEINEESKPNPCEEETTVEENKKGPKLQSWNDVLFSQILENDYSSIKHLLKRLHAVYPSIEMKTLFEILKANNFVYRDAALCLAQAGVSEERHPIKNPSAVSREVLQSLFTTPPLVESPVEAEPRLCVKGKKEESRYSSTFVNIGTIQSEASSIMKEIEKAHGKTYGSWDDYERHRASANQHWASMREYYQQAAAAYQKGEYARAGILSSKGHEYRRLAEEAKERAKARLTSLNTFEWESDVSLNLFGQHIGDVRRLLKLNLNMLQSIPSIKSLILITDQQGLHSEGRRSKLESAVKSYLERKGVDWVEVAPHHFKVIKSKTESHHGFLQNEEEF